MSLPPGQPSEDETWLSKLPAPDPRISALIRIAGEFRLDAAALGSICERMPGAFAALCRRQRLDLDRACCSQQALLPHHGWNALNLLPLIDTTLRSRGQPWRMFSQVARSPLDQIQRCVDIAADIARLTRAGYVYGAVAVARNLLEEATHLLERIYDAPCQMDGEKKEDWLRRVWSSGEHPNPEHAVTAWVVLSELMHGRDGMGFACDFEWTWPPTEGDPPMALITIIDDIWASVTYPLDVAWTTSWLVEKANESSSGISQERLLAVFDASDEPPVRESGLLAQSLGQIDFLLPYLPPGQAMMRNAHEYRRFIESVVGGYEGDLLQTPSLREAAVVERRGRAVEHARYMFGLEASSREEGFDPHITGVALMFRLNAISDAARIAATYADDFAKAALVTAASALDSAVVLWLEDDEVLFACVRGVIEQAARARTWRVKPAQAARLQETLASSSRWVEKAGWKRLNAMLSALGEFAHVAGEPHRRRQPAKQALRAYVPPEHTDPNVSRVRGDTIDAVAMVLASEVAHWLAQADPRIAQAFRREVILDGTEHDVSRLESLLNRGLSLRATRRTSPESRKPD